MPGLWLAAVSANQLISLKYDSSNRGPTEIMSARIVRVTLTLLIFVLLVSYVFYLNPQSATVTLRGGAAWQGPMALILIGAFTAGALVCTLVWFLLGARYQFRERKMLRRERMIETHRELMVGAREQLASGKQEAARAVLAKIVDRDPQDVIARILLSETYVKESNLPAALSVLDQARALHPKNIELLFRAAELNAALGNQTAAFDNMSLALAADPRNELALKYLVTACAGLGRYLDAIEHQRQRIRLASHTEHDALQRELAQLELRLVDATHPPKSKERRAGLEDVLRRHREYEPALEQLGDMARDDLEIEAASKYYVRAYRTAPLVRYLEKIATLWIGADQPDRMVAVLRSLISASELSSRAAFEARVYFTALLLKLENTEEALAWYRELKRLTPPNASLERARHLIDALVQRKQGATAEAFDTLVALFDGESPVPGLIRSDDPPSANGSWSERLDSKRAAKAPSPTLSTS